ncbi:MAG: hypothetical protein SGJ21_15880 [Alphaproteobacteria bacterium]|nr:hypothetical protein [Alphaproteobacteria bacterium]
MDAVSEVWSQLVGAFTNQNPSQFPLALAGLAATAILIWFLKGRAWAYFYVALIPFLNWTFGRSDIPTFDLTPAFGWMSNSAAPIIFNPLTILTGFVFVVRDFVQREMGHRVLILMALAIGWSFYYSWPVIALASAVAFAISEAADWLIFTFTRYRLSTRILLSSVVAAPVDTTVFLYGADLARQMNGDPAGIMFNTPNWIFFIVGKLVGALVVSWMIRRREERGTVDPAAA